MAEDRQLQDRVRGMLLCGAAGDALGAPVEFRPRVEIERRWGPLGPETYVAGEWPAGSITDDTQMTLFTAEGIIRATARFADRGLCHPPSVVNHAYLRWLHTQGVRVPFLDHFPRFPDGWLVKQRFLHARRAPGNTCLSELQECTDFGREPAANDSKGCGGLMRMGPAGVLDSAYPNADVPLSFDQGVAFARLSHGHPTGYLAAGYFARLLSLVFRGHGLQLAAETALRELKDSENHEELTAAVLRALRLAERGAVSTDAVESLGAGWVAEEAMAIGLYAALVAPDVRTGLRLAVAHGGDSDSTGSIAGNLLGALHGEAAVPEDLLAGLEGREVIRQVADDLVLFAADPASCEALQREAERYPPW